MRVRRLVDGALFKAMKCDPCLKQTAKAPRIGATSTLHTSTPSPSAPLAARNMKGVDPAEESLQTTELDHERCGCVPRGLNANSNDGGSSLLAPTGQWYWMDCPAASRSSGWLEWSSRPSICKSMSSLDWLVSTSRGRSTRAWHSAPKTSSGAIVSAWMQRTSGRFPTDQPRVLQLGGMYWLSRVAATARLPSFRRTRSTGSCWQRLGNRVRPPSLGNCLLFWLTSRLRGDSMPEQSTNQ
mmetsp:Transcript_75420/g.200316  ORF Transcript_75420/g.200316 Transcript_75420/m.200316 type:complete len:240 (+) Transcript_75420:182-901(+)